MFTGAELKDFIIILGGNVFIAILVVRMVTHYAKREWGDLLTNLLGAIFIGWIVYSTDTFINFLKWAANKITGGQAGGETAAAYIDALPHGLTMVDALPQVAAVIGLAA